MRVLVVDDEVALCSGVADFLREEGFDVEEAHDGAGALVLAQQRGASISAVLADINMPGMDGIEMWQRMKPMLPAECKVVFMSGLAKKYLEDGRQIPGDVLQKPFPLKLLRDKLNVAHQKAS